jgi:ketosteroid isomerase-like protein
VSDRTAQAVLVAEQEVVDALLASDPARLAPLLAEEYIQVGGGGRLLDRAGMLASFDGGERHWDFAVSDEHQVRLYGDVAVVVARWTARGVNHGEAFDYAARYVAVWLWRDGRWQMVSDQSTTIDG